MVYDPWGRQMSQARLDMLATMRDDAVSFGNARQGPRSDSAAALAQKQSAYPTRLLLWHYVHRTELVAASQDLFTMVARDG